MIESIEKQNVADIVYRKMLDMVIEGNWKEGDMIPSENDLCEAFSVSRNTIRQGIHRLSALGILTSRQGKGTFVQRIDAGFYMNLLVPAVFLGDKDSISVLEFMKAIQVECARIVCRNAKTEDIQKLAAYMEKMRTTKDYARYFEYDMGYHFYLAELTGNPLFIKCTDIATQLLHVYLQAIVEFHGSHRSIEQHQDCYEALLRRDVDCAARVMGEHYDMLLKRMSDWLDRKTND